MAQVQSFASLVVVKQHDMVTPVFGGGGFGRSVVSFSPIRVFCPPILAGATNETDVDMSVFVGHTNARAHTHLIESHTPISRNATLARQPFNFTNKKKLRHTHIHIHTHEEEGREGVMG